MLVWGEAKVSFGRSRYDQRGVVQTMDIIDRDSFNPLTKALIGDGLPGLMGHKWAAHRKIANPAFNMEKVKVKVI